MRAHVCVCLYVCVCVCVCVVCVFAQSERAKARERERERERESGEGGGEREREKQRERERERETAPRDACRLICTGSSEIYCTSSPLCDEWAILTQANTCACSLSLTGLWSRHMPVTHATHIHTHTHTHTQTLSLSLLSINSPLAPSLNPPESHELQHSKEHLNWTYRVKEDAGPVDHTRDSRWGL